jgi:hypothetical protein
MPHKFNESRRHKIPTVRYRVTNTEGAVEAWHAPPTGERGGQPLYSAIAIETGLALGLVFHQPLRQTEGLLRSVANMLEVDIRVPDHTTLSRRGAA